MSITFYRRLDIISADRKEYFHGMHNFSTDKLHILVSILEIQECLFNYARHTFNLTVL